MAIMESEQYVCYLEFYIVSNTTGDCVRFTAYYLVHIDSGTNSFKAHKATATYVKSVAFHVQGRRGNITKELPPKTQRSHFCHLCRFL